MKMLQFNAFLVLLLFGCFGVVFGKGDGCAKNDYQCLYKIEKINSEKYKSSLDDYKKQHKGIHVDQNILKTIHNIIASEKLDNSSCLYGTDKRLNLNCFINATVGQMQANFSKEVEMLEKNLEEIENIKKENELYKLDNKRLNKIVLDKDNNISGLENEIKKLKNDVKKVKLDKRKLIEITNSKVRELEGLLKGKDMDGLIKQLAIVKINQEHTQAVSKLNDMVSELEESKKTLTKKLNTKTKEYEGLHARYLNQINDSKGKEKEIKGLVYSLLLIVLVVVVGVVALYYFFTKHSKHEIYENLKSGNHANVLDNEIEDLFGFHYMVSRFAKAILFAALGVSGVLLMVILLRTLSEDVTLLELVVKKESWTVLSLIGVPLVFAVGLYKAVESNRLNVAKLLLDLRNDKLEKNDYMKSKQIEERGDG